MITNNNICNIVICYCNFYGICGIPSGYEKRFAMENEPLVRSFTVVENGDFPRLCEITIL